MKIKETDGDKEGLTDENYVYMFVKNETWRTSQKRNDFPFPPDNLSL